MPADRLYSDPARAALNAAARRAADDGRGHVDLADLRAIIGGPAPPLPPQPSKWDGLVANGNGWGDWDDM